MAQPRKYPGDARERRNATHRVYMKKRSRLRKEQATRPEHLISQSDAARLLNLSRKTIWSHIQHGNFQAEAWEGRRYIVKASLSNHATRRPMKSPPGLISQAEAARRLQVSRERIRQKVAAGHFETRKIGKHVFIVAKEIPPCQDR